MRKGVGAPADAGQALVSDQAAARLDPPGFDPSRVLRVAVVRSRDGYITVCGPNDFGKDHDDPMNAALCWHLESGHIPADILWASISLPPLPDIAELTAQAERGEYPKSWIEEDEA